MKIKHATDILQNAAMYNTTLPKTTSNKNKHKPVELVLVCRERRNPIQHIDERSRVGGIRGL